MVRLVVCAAIANVVGAGKMHASTRAMRARTDLLLSSLTERDDDLPGYARLTQ